MKVYLEKRFYYIAIICCVLCSILFWNFFLKLSKKICQENTITVCMDENSGSEANIWLNWFPGFEILEIHGFEELEERHYVADTSGARIKFYTEDVYSGNILCIIGEGSANLNFRSGLYNKNIECKDYDDGSAVLYVEQSKYLNFIKYTLNILFVIISGILAAFLAEYILQRINLECLKDERLIILFLYLTMGILFLSGMLQNTFSVDDYTYYSLYSEGYRFDKQDYAFVLFNAGMKDGRPVWALLYIVFDFVCRGFFYLYQPVVICGCIVIMSFIAKEIYNVFVDACKVEKKDVVKKVIVFLGAGICVFNPYAVEILSFHKVNLIYLIASLCSVISAKLYFNIKVNRGGKFWYAVIEIMLILSVFNYQPYAVWFVLVCSTILFVKYVEEHLSLWQWIKEEMEIGVLYALPIILNFLFVLGYAKLFAIEKGRVDFNGIGNKMEKFFSEIWKVLYNGHGRMETPYFLFCLCLLTLLILILLWKNYNFTVCIVYMVTLLILIGSIFYFQLATELWSIDERTCSMILGVPFILSMIPIGISKLKYNEELNHLLLILACIVSLLYIRDTHIDIEKIVSNNICDAELCRLYEREIRSYEQKEGVEIERISFIQNGDYFDAFNYGIGNSSEPYWSALHIDWAKLELLNIISGKNYELLVCDEENIISLQEKLKDNGIICFENETAYIEIY